MEYKEDYDVVIVGGGIIGTALLYTLSNYTDLKRIAIVEKHTAFASVNSDGKSNSQTLHFGDVETNYTEEKARDVNEAAKLILGYEKSEGLSGKGVVKRCQKLLIAVGDEEIEYAQKWYNAYAKKLYKGLRKISPAELKRIEPNLLKGRSISEKIVVYKSGTGYMADYGRISKSFVKKSRDAGRKIDIMMNTRINSFAEEGGRYRLRYKGGEICCRSVVFSAGPYSLYFAKSIGIGKNYSIIATGGGFFRSKKVLNGKVYRVQTGKMPFVAIHGDPDINNGAVTRFGPVIYLPLGVEKEEFQLLDYAKISGAMEFIPTSLTVLSKYRLYGIISRHISYRIPLIGKALFLRNEAGKLVPSLKYSDLELAVGYGGISPRIVDRRTMTLNIGEEKIRKGNAIFNIAPSPGASSSLSIAEDDAKYLSKKLHFRFDQDKFNKKLRSVRIN